MPTVPSIRTSVENKTVLVLDEHAKNGVFRRDSRGRLIAYTGGFSVVFPYVSSDGTKWAFRCWHSDISNTQKRYEIISDAIRKANMDFLCEFDYIEKGVNVEGKIYPTTRMRWVDGVTIKEYICQNRNSKQTLLTLADDFLKMTQTLHSHSLAHGDLQHGNILVSSDHKIHLVDYDSFYCPKLKGEPDTVTGLPDYQHPARKTNKYVSEKLDYFSELIIYLSILAIAENPSLVDKYQVEGAERMLFSKEDFEDLKHSQIYQDIKSLGKEYAELLGILEEYLSKKSIEELEPFEKYLLDNKIAFTTSALKVVRNKQEVNINWNVPFNADVELLQNGVIIPNCNKLIGSYTTIPNDSAKFELVVTTPESKRIIKELFIGAFDECEIDFKADKQYVFPTIPVLLTWNVRYAKKVWLDSEEVEVVGSKVIEPEKAITCTLSAEDEFGIKEKKVDIQMLPIPLVKSILAPMPNFVSNLSVTIQQPRYNVDVKFPQIDIGWINIGVPKVPSLMESGLYQKLQSSHPLPKVNLMSSIKRVFNYIIRK
jgi:serine/threonine protein kinase